MRRYVRKRKQELGLARRETYVPQSYDWGAEAQVDWYEAWADLDGERRKVNVFAMRSMASGVAFHCAFERATQQSFLETHERAFDYFGGVFRRLRYDNLTSAVKKILRGFRREESARFIAFRSHWRYHNDFCTPAETHKGWSAGRSRLFPAQSSVPVPKARDLAELNEQLLKACRADEARCIHGREQTVGAAMLTEREHLQPLTEQDFRLPKSASRLWTGSIARGSGPPVIRFRRRAARTWRQRYTPVSSSSGRKERGSHGTSVVTASASRFLIWNITSMCWSESRERWLDRNRSSNGGAPGAGPGVSTCSGRN